MLKPLPSISHSNALIVVQIIKNNINSTYYTDCIATDKYLGFTANICVQDM